MFKIIVDESQDKMYENKRYHHWYGGDVLELETNQLPDYKVLITAVGDIRASLKDLEGYEIAYIRDRQNGGSFEQLSRYIHSDEELELAIEAEHDAYMLEVEETNHWECVVISPFGEYIYIDYVLDAYSLDDALKEVFDNEYSIIECIKDHINE